MEIGGGAPVSVQSMCNTRTADLEATIAQIKSLEMAGCDIARVAVPDRESARAIRRIKSAISIRCRRRHPFRLQARA